MREWRERERNRGRECESVGYNYHLFLFSLGKYAIKCCYCWLFWKFRAYTWSHYCSYERPIFLTLILANGNDTLFLQDSHFHCFSFSFSLSLFSYYCAVSLSLSFSLLRSFSLARKNLFHDQILYQIWLKIFFFQLTSVLFLWPSIADTDLHESLLESQYAHAYLNVRY